MTIETANLEQGSQWKSAALSFFFHLLVILALFLFWRSVGPSGGSDEPDRRVALVLTTATENQVDYLEKEDVVEPPADQAPAAPALPSQEPPPAAFESQLDLGPLTQIDSPNLDAAKMTAVPSKSRDSAKTIEFTDEELKQIAREQQAMLDRMPQGEPASIDVFGAAGLTGRNFVFVLDRSKSMGSDGLGVLDRANRELTSAIGQLSENHKFQIVAYHHQTVTLEKRALLVANGNNKSKVGEFIDNLAAFGGTAHSSALISALALRPDVIVLMTDGGDPGLTESQLQTLKRIAGRRTQIHCVHFGIGALQDSNNFMTVLAEQNQGSYRYIDVNDWTR